MPDIIAWGDHRENIKVITKGIVMAHNNRCLLVRYVDYRWSRWIRNILNIAGRKRIDWRKVLPDCFKWSFE